MKTFFENRYLPDLIDKNDMIVLDFLKAAEIIPEFFDMLGTTMKIPKKDVEGNMKKILNAYNSLRGRATTLKFLLEEEKNNGSFKNDSSGSVGLLWFTRTLEFIVELMIGILSKRKIAERDGNDSLSEVARTAYENSLKRHHNFLMGKAFGIVLYASPKRSVLIRKFAYEVDGLEEQVYSSLEEFITRVKPILAALQQILYDFQMETPKSS